MILVTGGTGYIGSHTVVSMIEQGYDPLIVDNFMNSKPEVLDRIEMITGKRPLFYEADIRDEEKMEQIFSEHEIEAVIHFAGLKAVGESVSIPLEYYDNNINGTLVLLETMKRHNVKKIIFSSSATVYDRFNTMPLTEESKTGNCTNPYGWTKFMIEEIIMDICNADSSWCGVLLRYFNPIGAHESGLLGEDPQGIPNNLMPYICRVAEGRLEKLSVYGDDYPTHDGTGVRDYIHVVDLAEGHIKAIDLVFRSNGAIPVNLGTGTGYSVMDVLNTFMEVNGIDVPYVIAGRRAGDIAECYADPSRAEELLGWKAEFDLKKMCRDSWNFIAKNMKQS